MLAAGTANVPWQRLASTLNRSWEPAQTGSFITVRMKQLVMQDRNCQHAGHLAGWRPRQVLWDQCP